MKVSFTLKEETVPACLALLHPFLEQQLSLSKKMVRMSHSRLSTAQDCSHFYSLRCSAAVPVGIPTVATACSPH